MTKRSDHLIQRGRQMLADGFTITEAAAELRVNRRTLSGWLADAGVTHPVEDQWTKERIGSLRQLFDDGLSYTQIGRSLGVSRSAVSGKLRRLGVIDTRSKPSKPAHVAAPKSVNHTSAQRARAQGRSGGLSLAVVAKLDPSQHAPRQPMPDEPTAAGVKLLDLRFHHCRWPMAMQDGERTFCGARRRGEGPYCAEHGARAYQPPAPGRPRTANEIARSIRKYVA